MASPNGPGNSIPLLKLDSVRKSFGEVEALKPVTLEVTGEQVLGLIGENGAGKSTLLKILSGVHYPDSGRILWQGHERHFHTPHDALTAGIATIHQELAGFDHLTVAENLMMQEPWPRRRWGGVDWNQLYFTATERLRKVGVTLPADRAYSELSSAQRQELAIARALCQNSRLLVLDEPTAALSEPEIDRLFRQLRRLRSQGVAVIYVSHRLDEIRALTDRVTVLRDGEQVAEYSTAEATVERMVRDMVGRPVDQVYPKTRSTQPGQPLLEVSRVSWEPKLYDISFTLHAGEIVGMAGLVGAGRSELARALYGLYPLTRGELRLRGRRWQPAEPRDALDRGLIYIPEERKRHGFVLQHSLRESLSIGFSDQFLCCGIVPPAQAEERVRRILQSYGIRAEGPDQPIGTLSGGNQQKALLGRWLDRQPEVVILDEPTRGVDIGAKTEIHALIDRLAARQKAILLISSDLPEVIGMSDRVLVMHEGHIAAELQGEKLTQENVLLAASGLQSGTS